MRQILGVALGNHGDLDPVIERRQELRQRPATGLPTAADSILVDLRACQQIVDPADAVPRTEQAKVGTQQNEAASCIFVLAGAARSDGRLAGTPSRVLNALSLSEGVVGQY